MSDISMVVTDAAKGKRICCQEIDKNMAEIHYHMYHTAPRILLDFASVKIDHIWSSMGLAIS